VDIRPNPSNPRAITKEAMDGLVASIARFGVVEPIVVNTFTGCIVGGHQRIQAMQSLGMTETEVVLVDLPLEEEMTLNVALNNKAIQGSWSNEINEILQGISTAFPEDYRALKLDCIYDEIDTSVSEEVICESIDEEDVPEVSKGPATTKRGDVWTLGKHRLMCGDSTMIDDVEKLMAGETVDCLMTDPPYGVDYSSKNAFLNAADKGNCIQTPITNDAIENYREWFASFLSIIPFSSYNTFYVWMSGLELHNLRLAIEDCGYKWGDYLVWVKSNHVLGRKDYNARHEFCVYGWKGRHKFYGDFSTTVLEYDKPLKNDLHPTMKPVPLFEKLITDGSPKRGIVLDLFGGSGTTLIACEQSGRRARLMELDEHYCDVIVERYVKLIGTSEGVFLNGVTGRVTPV